MATLQVMVYAQLFGPGSLRTVTEGFNAHASHHYHLDACIVKRSTLSDANRVTRPEAFAELAEVLMGGVRRTLRREVKPQLHDLDHAEGTGL